MAYQHRHLMTINQLKQAIIEWGKLLQHLVDCTIGQWCHWLECIIQQQGRCIEHLFDVKNARCDSYSGHQVRQ